jgi:hypothetical protein
MTEPRSDEERSVAELLRVNRELAAEVRSLTLSRTATPRPSQLPAARSVARLLAERDELAAKLESSQAELVATRADRDRLELQNREFAEEIARLSAGLRGLLRRLRGRILHP